MRCISYSKFGPASEVLMFTEVTTPEPQDGEVLVRLHFSGVNPSDAKARAGNRPGVTKPQYELVIPNSDGSGIITAVGKGVDTMRIGEKVWIWNGQWQRPYGTAADFIALPSEQAIQIPSEISLETGACLGIPGLTAAHCTLGDGSLAGKTILISGGSGSVGNISIQLAKWSGAQVISTGSINRFDHIYNAGADHVFDYGDPELAKKIMKISPSGLDRAIEVEFGQNIDFLHEVMKPYGTVSIYGSAKNMVPVIPFGQYLYKAIKLDIALIYILPEPERKLAIQNLYRAHKAGALETKIDTIYNLEDCSLAHDLTLKPGRKGAVLLRII